jgi:hypothetical protein
MMDATKAKLLWAGGMFLVAWLFREKKPGTVTTEITIDANVNSDTFGLPLSTDDDADAVARGHAQLLSLVNESNEAIAAYDATHPAAP